MEEPGRHSTCPAEHFLCKNFGRKQNFMTFGQGTSLCRFHGRKSLAEFSTPHFMCPEKHFETKSFFFGEKHKLDSVCWFSMENFRLFGKMFQQEGPYQIFRDQRNILKFFLKKIQLYLFSRFFSRKLWLARKLRVRQIGVLSVQSNISMDRETGRNKIFLTSGLRARVFQVFRRKKFCRVAKTAFHVTRATCGVNWFFSRKSSFECFYWQLAEKLQNLGKNLHQGFCVSTTFSKEKLNEPGRHSTCPAEHFEEKILAETKTFRPLGNEREKAGFLAKQFWQCCHFGIPCVHRNTLGQKISFSKKNLN